MPRKKIDTSGAPTQYIFSPKSKLLTSRPLRLKAKPALLSTVLEVLFTDVFMFR